MDDYENGVYTFVTKKGRCKASVLLLSDHARIEWYYKGGVVVTVLPRKHGCKFIRHLYRRYSGSVTTTAQIVECN